MIARKMSMNAKRKFEINNETIKKYIETFYKLYYLNNEKNTELYNFFDLSLKDCQNIINDFIKKYPKQKGKIYSDIIKQLMLLNNGILPANMLRPLNIDSKYLTILERNNVIERISRGIYILPDIFEDSYYTLGQKYKKVIFSHMNALYFYGLTEEFPHDYTVTVPRGYHVAEINKKCNVFYVPNDFYELGLIEAKTPSGNIVKAYDIERCICDIIKDKGRMDLEQVKKVLKKYLKMPNKNIAKLQEYARKMNINNRVMKMVGYYE